jgi:hypothetical protein
MLENLADELHSDEEVELPSEEPSFGEQSNPIEEFQRLWETAANQFSEQSKSLDELSARLNPSKRQTIPEVLKQFQLLIVEALILTRTLHKKLEKELGCDELKKRQQ